MENISISVIIPAYNSQRFLSDAINSILSQTYFNYIKEIIIVDDGSRDNTKEVVHAYSDKKFIKYIYQENKGPAAARNKGIEKASGKFLAFLDSDDLWKKNKVKQDLNYLSSHENCKLIFSHAIIVNEQVEILQKNYSKIPVNKKELIKKFFFGDISRITSTILVEKDAAINVGGYPEEMSHREDHFFMMLMIKHYEVCSLNEYNVLSRNQEDSMTKKQRNSENPLQKLENYNPFIDRAVEEFSFLKKFEGMVRSQLYRNAALKYAKRGKRFGCFRYVGKSILMDPLNYRTYTGAFAAFFPNGYRKLRNFLKS